MSEDGGRPSPERVRKTRAEREEAVRKKYDFSVIRALRQQKGLTIEKFARVCGLSYAPISRIETNLIKPNLETLDKIAEGLGMATYKLVAMAERQDADIRSGSPVTLGSVELQRAVYDEIEVSWGDIAAETGTDERAPRTQGRQTVLVEEGRLEVTVNGKIHEVAAGQSIRYDRVFAHSLKAVEPSRIVVISESGR